MTKRHIVVAMAVALVLLSLAFAFVTARSSSSVTLHYLNASPIDDSVLLTFAIDNRSSHSLHLTPRKLQKWDGTAWAECPVSIRVFSQTDISLLSKDQLGFIVTRFPTGRLRLVCQTQSTRKGLAGFLVRVRLRISGDRWYSLNPFDKTVTVIREPDVVSEEFSVQ